MALVSPVKNWIFRRNDNTRTLDWTVQTKSWLRACIGSALQFLGRKVACKDIQFRILTLDASGIKQARLPLSEYIILEYSKYYRTL